MMNQIALNERDVKMLELLAQGEPSKEIARKLGYRAGTMRVYLHDLYRKLHVSNKTAAVVWYFDNFRAPPAPAARESTAAASASLEETVGDMAVRTDLFTTLGAMSTLIGPYGKLWQVAVRLKGTKLEGETERRARRCRVLWEALLRGDFAAGKKRYDQDHSTHFTVEASPERVLLAVLLLLGGYTSAADRVIGPAPRMGRRMPGMLTAGEREFLSSLRGLTEFRRHDGLVALHKASAPGASEPLRHVAMAVLHHVYRQQGDNELAGRAAETLWAEAESSEGQLEAMGERSLCSQPSLPATPAEPRRQAPVRRKEAVTAR